MFKIYKIIYKCYKLSFTSLLLSSERQGTTCACSFLQLIDWLYSGCYDSLSISDCKGRHYLLKLHWEMEGANILRWVEFLKVSSSLLSDLPMNITQDSKVNIWKIGTENVENKLLIGSINLKVVRKCQLYCWVPREGEYL